AATSRATPGSPTRTARLLWSAELVHEESELVQLAHRGHLSRGKWTQRAEWTCFAGTPCSVFAGRAFLPTAPVDSTFRPRKFVSAWTSFRIHSAPASTSSPIAFALV